MITGTMPLDVTLYESATRPDLPQLTHTTWDVFAGSICNIRETNCSTLENPCLGKNCRGKRTAAGPPVRLSRPHRLSINVEVVTLAVGDLDGIDNAAAVAVYSALQGYEFVLHSTHSHLHGGPG